MRDQSLYVWCLHCEKVSLSSEVGKNQECCTTPGCSGGWMDINDWEPGSWPRNNHPEYPEIPVVGELYPLY